jgi:hypothetical protein
VSEFTVGGRRNFVLRGINLRDFRYMTLRKPDVGVELV